MIKMQPNPSSRLQRRQKQHRRQNSTPSLLENGRASILSPPEMRRCATHKRGLSLDQQSPGYQQRLQDSNLNIATSAGPYENPQDRLREAQQRELARSEYFCINQSPTLASFNRFQLTCQEETHVLTNRSSSENYVSTACIASDSPRADHHQADNPHLKEALKRIQQQHINGPDLPFTDSLNHSLLDNTSWSFSTTQDDKITQQFGNSVPKNIRRLSTQSELSPQTCAPSKQIDSNNFPVTLAMTPFRKLAGNSRYNLSVQCIQKKGVVSANVAQPASMQRAKSLQGVPGSTFTQGKVVDMPSPSHTASFDVGAFEMFDAQNPESSKFPEASAPNGSESITTPDAKPYSQSPSVSSPFYSSPELASVPLPGKNFCPTPKVPIELATSVGTSSKVSDSAPASPSKTNLSPRVASIDSLNLDSRVQASITETGVTIEEIASYISGPDPQDRKWVCLHPGCGRRFGRKENIRSHIQTHLGDRQYKCDHCDKCFVRGHDLKRHAKIHTGDKPYECLCGNVFARPDALTRHRQRGMCIGGYKGIVRKATKRGRPRKHRPGMEERRGKSTKTRERVAARSIASSISGSDSSADSPLTEILESISIQGSSPPESSLMFQPDIYALPPDVFTFTPPASPGFSTGNKPSSPGSYRSLTPATDDEALVKSLSRRALEKITEEFLELPPISETGACFESDLTALPSPYAVPTLIESSTESNIDMFLSQDTTSGFDKNQSSCIDEPDMVSFVEFGARSNFAGEFETFQGKNIMNDDFFLQFHGEDQQTDTLFKSFPLS